MVWGESIQKGLSKNGNQNTQKELVEQEMTAKQIITMFLDQLKICIPHYQKIDWMRLIQSIDFSRLWKDTLLIFTDFLVMMLLRAFQLKNSSVDGYVVNDKIVVAWNR